MNFVEVTIGGKDRKLKFDAMAIYQIEEKFGMGIGAILSEVQVGFRVLVLFYWAGLKHEEPGLTIERVAKMLTKKITDEEEDVESLFTPVMQALEKSKLLKTKRAREEQDDPDDEEADPKN